MQIAVPIYLIIMLVAIPQLSETIYIPALVHLSQSFNISASAAEATLTTYLLGFGFGVLVWGSLSDKIGRKPGFILGLLIYAFACYGCFYTTQIESFFVFRFLQAFGASVGSVLGQAVARDAITAENRGRLYSVISMAMAFAPALGPVIGSITIHYSNWNTVFLVLIFISLIAILLVIFKLPETRDKSKIMNDSYLRLYKNCFVQMIGDSKIIGYGFLVGSVNGILFGYFAEAPFFFMKNLRMSSDVFGITSFIICIPLFIGGIISHRLHNKNYSSHEILSHGISIVLFSSTLFYLLVITNVINTSSQINSIVLSYGCLFGIIVGVSMIIPNALSHALQNYSQYSGTAASLFGFYYYGIVAMMTALMAYLHDGTLTQLPLFMCIQGALMLGVYQMTIKKQ